MWSPSSQLAAAVRVNKIYHELQAAVVPLRQHHALATNVQQLFWARSRNACSKLSLFNLSLLMLLSAKAAWPEMKHLAYVFRDADAVLLTSFPHCYR